MTEQNSKETLVQNGVLKRSNRVSFQDNRTIRVDSQVNNRTITYRIDVIALKNKHSRSFNFAWPWLIGGLLLFILLLVVMNTSFIFPDPAAWQAILVKVVLGILAVVCIVLFIKLSYSKYVFKSRHGKVPMLDIWASQPSGKAVRSFIKLLEQRIDNAHNHMNLTMEQQLTGEMKMLRRLVEEGVIPQNIYDAARPKLMGKF